METSQVEILLVEDNANDAELTMRALRKRNLGNKIYHVIDGEQALEYLLDPNVPKMKLILLDIKLPKVDGIEVLKAIRGHEKLKKTPVVMLTSSNEDRDVIESYNLGVNSYIVKPVEFDKFTEAVSEIGLYWMILNRTPQSDL
jgi:two-component system, response regulator